MRLTFAVTIAEDSQTKQFSAEQFRKVINSSHLVGATCFWRMLEGLAAPEARTRHHATGVLLELARQVYQDCSGWAYSPQEAQCFQYLGLAPKGIRPPGSLAKEAKWQGADKTGESGSSPAAISSCLKPIYPPAWRHSFCPRRSPFLWPSRAGRRAFRPRHVL